MWYVDSLKKFGLVLACAGLLIGCTEETTDDSSTTSLTISGSLGGSGSSSLKLSAKVSAFAVSDYKIRCVTLSGDPKAGEGEVGSDGAFSVSIEMDDEAVPVGCFVLDTTNSDAIAATFSFDQGSTGMDGSNAQAGSMNASGGEKLELGEINFDPDTGSATVDTTKISRSGNTKSNSGTWNDPSGSWTMTCVDSKNYECPQEAVGGSFPIYLNQFKAVDGSSVEHTGLSIWSMEDGNQYQACGSKEGLEDILPAGWSAHSDYTSQWGSITFATIPNAEDLELPSWDGNYLCDAGGSTDSDSSGAIECDEVLNGGTAGGTDGWGNGSATYTDADCQAMCVIENLREVSGCNADYEVDYSWIHNSSRSAGDIATELASFNESTGVSTNNVIVRQSEPRNRHVIGELIKEGNAGTVMSKKTQSRHICIDNGDGSGCTTYQCDITENVRVNMLQESSSSAVIEVLIKSSLDSSSPSQCSQEADGNYVYEDISRETKFLMNASKN